jgi:hypothetical protein
MTFLNFQSGPGIIRCNVYIVWTGLSYHKKLFGDESRYNYHR